MAPIFIKRYGGLDDGVGKYTELYGFKMSKDGSVIEYIEDNKNYTPCSSGCKNDYANSTTKYFTLNLGSWANAFFMKGIKPCMLRYDGTVDYYLNPNDYTKKENGSASDIANSSYAGNVMVEFPKIYWKLETASDGTITAYVCDGKKDKDFVCWSHLDVNGNEIDHCYMSAYLGYVVNGVLRSISGVKPTKSYYPTLVNYAKANNPSGVDIWDIDVYCDRVLLTILIILLGKTIDSQSVFGYGACILLSTSVDIATGTGTDDVGLFGSNIFYSAFGTYKNKVFGIESPWGHISRICRGFVVNTASSKATAVRIKMTPSNKDGGGIGYTYNTASNQVNTGVLVNDSDILGCIGASLGNTITSLKAGNNIGIIANEVATVNVNGTDMDVLNQGIAGDMNTYITTSGMTIYFLTTGGGFTTRASSSTITSAGMKGNILKRGIFAREFYAHTASAGTVKSTGLSCKPLKK